MIENSLKKINTYTKDDDRQSVCACAVLRAKDQAQRRRPTLGLRDPTLVALLIGNVAVESRNAGKMSSHSRHVAIDTICKLYFFFFSKEHTLKM